MENKNQNTKLIYLGVLGALFLLILGTSFATTSTAQSEYYYLTDLSAPTFLPSTIYAGDTVSMALNVTNRGGTYSITNLSATPDFGSQFELISNNSSIPLIIAGSTKTITFTFKVAADTLPGYYPVSIDINYIRSGLPQYNDEKPIVEKFNINIPIAKTEKNIDISVNPSVITPSNQTELNFTFKNLGGSPVSNISFYWTESSNLILPIGSDNKRYISYINPGESATITYNVAADPNITTGIYPINATVTFSDQKGVRTQTSQLGLIVGGTTDFDISTESTSNTISVSIANIGSNNAGAVIAKLITNGVTEGANTVILGNLNKGDYTIASFTLPSVSSNFVPNADQTATPQNFRTRNISDTNQTSAMAREVTLQIDYTDTTGKRQSVTKQISLSANTLNNSTNITATGFARNRSSNSYLTPLALLVIIIAGIVIYNLKKAKKSWKKAIIVIVIEIIIFAIVMLVFNSNLVETIIATIISIIIALAFFKPSVFEKLLAKIKHAKKKK